MGSFCKYSFFVSAIVWHLANAECGMPNGEWRGLPISNFQLPIDPNKRSDGWAIGIGMAFGGFPAERMFS